MDEKDNAHCVQGEHVVEKAMSPGSGGEEKCEIGPLTSTLLLKSAYEQAREDNIKRNNAILQSLGLLSSKPHLSKPCQSSEPRLKVEKKRKRPDSSAVRRTSSRLRGEKAEVIQSCSASEAASPRGQPPPRPTFDMAKYERLIERHLHSGLMLPPTASYEHTVHRVKTMSEKALSTRVKVIERAHGAYAVIKMQMFAEVLILEGYEDVAKEADEALQRLLETPKFRGKNWHQMLEMAKYGKKKKK